MFLYNMFLVTFLLLYYEYVFPHMNFTYQMKIRISPGFLRNSELNHKKVFAYFSQYLPLLRRTRSDYTAFLVKLEDVQISL